MKCQDQQRQLLSSLGERWWHENVGLDYWPEFPDLPGCPPIFSLVPLAFPLRFRDWTACDIVSGKEASPVHGPLWRALFSRRTAVFHTCLAVWRIATWACRHWNKPRCRPWGQKLCSSPPPHSLATVRWEGLSVARLTCAASPVKKLQGYQANWSYRAFLPQFPIGLPQVLCLRVLCYQLGKAKDFHNFRKKEAACVGLCVLLSWQIPSLPSHDFPLTESCS